MSAPIPKTGVLFPRTLTVEAHDGSGQEASDPTVCMRPPVDAIGCHLDKSLGSLRGSEVLHLENSALGRFGVHSDAVPVSSVATSACQLAVQRPLDGRCHDIAAMGTSLEPSRQASPSRKKREFLFSGHRHRQDATGSAPQRGTNLGDASHHSDARTVGCPLDTRDVTTFRIAPPPGGRTLQWSLSRSRRRGGRRSKGAH